MEIPHTWRLEEGYSYMAKEFERGEMVVLQIESKVPRFGVVGGEGEVSMRVVVDGDLFSVFQEMWMEVMLSTMKMVLMPSVAATLTFERSERFSKPT